MRRQGRKTQLINHTWKFIDETTGEQKIGPHSSLLGTSLDVLWISVLIENYVSFFSSKLCGDC